VTRGNSARAVAGPRLRTLAVPTALIIVALLPASATANHSLKELVSTGPSGGNGPQSATFNAASQDGTRVFVSTDEALAPTDTDAATDVYERSNGVTTLVSVGDQPGTGNNAVFVAASPDGSHVLFKTADQLLAADTDGTEDLYERAGGTTTLFPSDAAAATSSASDYTVCPTLPAPIPCYSQNGSKLFFSTAKQLVGGDTDSGADVYERSAGSLSLLSTGPNGGNGPNGNALAGFTPDGLHVYFHSNESLVIADTDAVTDVYERTGGTTTLISTGPDGGNGANFAAFSGATPDGAHVFFVTIESLVAADTDTGCPGVTPCQDVYERTGSTTSLVSVGPGATNGPFTAEFSGVSNDGARAFFRTGEQLVSEDSDTAADVYERSGGTTTLVSTGSLPCSGGCSNATFGGLTPDGARVWFETAEPLEGNDGDIRRDVYERSGGATTLVSTGTGTPCCSDLFFHAASQNGTRVFFGTSSSSFERFAGDTTTLVSNGSFKAASLDGQRAFVQTSQALVGTDTDGVQDVYSWRVLPYAAPESASPLHVSLVPVFRQCGTLSNPTDSEHSPPLAVRSCDSPVTAAVAHMGAQASAYARIVSLPGDPQTATDEADVTIDANLTDVRTGSITGADYNPSPTADLTLATRWRLSDNASGPDQSVAATTTDFDFPVTINCVNTTDPGLGAGCGVLTSANAALPGAIKENKGSVIQAFRLRVNDAGPNGVVGDGDDALFAQQGVYIP
jgi:hypothetical protein